MADHNPTLFDWCDQAQPKFYVYELRDEFGVVFYIGKGQGKRMFGHVARALQKKTSCNPRLVHIRKILNRGGRVVPVAVFWTNNEDEAFAEEKRLIAFYGRENLTNLSDGGDGPSNPSPEVREKIAASRRGKKASAETRQKQREARLGIPRTTETKQKIAAYQKGRVSPWKHRKPSAETRAKMSKLKKGVKMPPGTGAKISASKMGHSVSEETRKRISAGKKGRSSPLKGIPLTEETKRKISAAKMGKKLSEESLRKRREDQQKKRSQS